MASSGRILRIAASKAHLTLLRTPPASAFARLSQNTPLTREKYTGPTPFSPVSLQQHIIQRRWRSQPVEQQEKWTLWDFGKVSDLSKAPVSKTIIIDVREPHEYADGYIPKAKNMPINSQPGGLALSPEDFEDKFGFEKPGLNDEVVFYCRAGVRSKAAAQLADSLGFTNVKEYRGSWLDWVEKGGEQKKP